MRALGYGTLAQSLSGLELPFDDVTDNRGYVAIAYDIGMITGVAGAGGQLKFLPRDSATREEAAAMLVPGVRAVHLQAGLAPRLLRLLLLFPD